MINFVFSRFRVFLVHNYHEAEAQRSYALNDKTERKQTHNYSVLSVLIYGEIGVDTVVSFQYNDSNFFIQFLIVYKFFFPIASLQVIKEKLF